jgi:hypothetical protein
MFLQVRVSLSLYWIQTLSSPLTPQPLFRDKAHDTGEHSNNVSLPIRYVLSIATTLESYAKCSRRLAIVGSKQPHFIRPNIRQLLGYNIPVGSVSV